jgi:outer membrane protein assembly factor BamE (lipoprotein component of BamABCDE complex)
MNTASAGFVAALALGGALVAGCTPVRETHGWVSDTASEAQVQPGVDTRTTVLARMGSPSTTGSFGATDWYYITALQEQYSYLKPRTTARTVTVVRFNADDVVDKVDKFGIERGRVVNYSNDKTPTRGRELGVLEQIFGTVGARLPTDREAEAERRR